MTHENTFTIGGYEVEVYVYTASKTASLFIDSKPITSPVTGKKETIHLGYVGIRECESVDEVIFKIWKNIFHMFNKCITLKQYNKIYKFLNQCKED